MKLPPGFTLDQSEEKAPKLPPGFKLDTEETAPKLPEGFSLDSEVEEPRSSVIGQASKLAGDALSVFETEQQKFSPEIVTQAKKELAEGGAPPPWMTAAADTVLFGNFAEATAALDSLFMDEPYEKRKQIREAMRQLRQEDAPVQTLVGTLGGFLTPGGAVSAAGKLAKGAKLSPKAALAAQAAAGTAQSAAIEAEEAAEGKELEAIGKSLAFDAVLGLGGAGLGKLVKTVKKGKKPAKKIDPETQAKVEQVAEIEKSIDENVELMNRHTDDISKLSDKELEEIVNLELANKRENITNDTLKAYNEYRALKKAYKETYGEVPTGSRGKMGELKDASKVGGMAFMDGQYVFRLADRKHGRRTEKAMNEVSRASNLLSHALTVPRNQVQKLLDTTKMNSKKMYDEVLEANRKGVRELSKLSPDTQGWAKLFDNFREMGNDLARKEGLGSQLIPKLSGGRIYIPNATLPIEQMKGIFQAKSRELTGKSLDSLTTEDAAKLMQDPDLVQAAKYLQDGNVSDPLKLRNILMNPQDAPVSLKLKDPGVALRRVNDEVPALIRETDMGKLADYWMNTVFPNIMMKKALSRVRMEAKALKEVDPVLGGYMMRYTDDLLGRRRGGVGIAKDLADKYREGRFMAAADAAAKGQNTRQAVNESLAELPEHMQAAMMNMYPYYLGLRVDGVVRNLAQPLQTTMMSIGSPLKDGVPIISKAMLESYGDLALNLGKNYRKGRKELAELGLLPANPTPQAWDNARRGLLKKRGAAGRTLSKVKHGADAVAMFLYQESDVLNRIVTLNAVNKLVPEMVQGTKRGKRFMRSMPPAYQKQVKDALEAGDNKLVRDEILQHLLAHTMYNYDKASMSEFGRYVGGIGSMFSKWPTAVGGDLVDMYQAQKYGQLDKMEAVSRVGWKYLAPFAMLSAAQSLWWEELAEENPELGQAIGRDLSAYSALPSIAPFVEGTIMRPPVFDIAENKEKSISMVPMATYLRFIDERLPRWMGENEDLFQEEKDAVKESIEDALD